LIVSLEPLETLRILARYGNGDVLTVTNTRPIHPVGVMAGRVKYPDVDSLEQAINRLSKTAWLLNVTDMALELGSPIMANIILLGGLVATNYLPISSDQVGREVRSSFPSSVVDLNLKALEMGINAIKSRAAAS
jgi:indolepyruvate ferredoxin oxidoreductase, beta subunit